MPQITAMTWSSAKDVLPHEAHHFTPWLAQNLDLLADVLGLDELELTSTEWKVESFALDILARGRDADGELRLVIENQYGATDHRHLGQILTYAAHAASGGHRVLAVWITEEVRPAHLAAVTFLNGVAAADESTFGMVLLRVRFAPAPVGWHVHFEVEAEPNAFLTARVGGGAGGSPVTAAERGDFIEAVVGLLDPPLEEAGLRRSGSFNRKHGAAVYRFPLGLEISQFVNARIVCARETTIVALYIERYADAARNAAVADALRDHYGPLLDTYALQVDMWHGSKQNIKRERVITMLDVGYKTGSPAAVASQAAGILSNWARMVTEHPISGIDAYVTARTDVSA